MSATTPNDQAGHARLGEVVRQQREQLGLSMDDVAARARVSRSSIHRLEHGAPFRPTPSKLARVLNVVGVEADSVRSLLPEDEYRGDVLHWLDRATMPDLPASIQAQAQAVDLLAIHPDGSIARIQASEHVEDLADALKSAGWTVTRPV